LVRGDLKVIRRCAKGWGEGMGSVSPVFSRWQIYTIDCVQDGVKKRIAVESKQAYMGV